MRFFTILVFSIFISSTIFSQKDRHSTSMQDAWLSCTATANPNTCLLYTSDAADERSSVDLGGRRIIKKKTQITQGEYHYKKKK